ncbi:GntR family transcriptional regulator, partial [Hyalangium sp.]|uniref:GntR family transcriptional regulator n=1 Tax=Hyalangium sp. TaxID=2028555 RepID=UPI002D28976D
MGWGASQSLCRPDKGVERFSAPNRWQHGLLISSSRMSARADFLADTATRRVADMERMGLVAHVEQQLERVISLGLLPEQGLLPSEHTLARQYGVSRATARQALQRLAARGLVVQHPGRRSRAVVLDEVVTLEDLGVALHADQGPAHPERRRLLEGYLALKRETTVELLASCCEHASETELERLQDACFALRDAARWKVEGREWVTWEFELLRLAARAADRPGHLLLIHSLERSFRTMAARVLPHLDSEAAQEWAWCAFHALGDRDAQSLRRELPTLLQAADERLLANLTPTRQAVVAPKAPHGSAEPLPGLRPEPESARGELPGASVANLSACHTGSLQAPPTAGSPPELYACHTGSLQAPPTAGSTPESPSTLFGQPSGDTALEAGELPGRREERGCFTWSPVPWPLVASPQGHPSSVPQSTSGLRSDSASLSRTACHTGSCHAEEEDSHRVFRPP